MFCFGRETETAVGHTQRSVGYSKRVFYVLRNSNSDGPSLTTAIPTNSEEDLTFMGPCVVSIFQYTVYPTRCNVTQFIYVWKLLHMFRVVTLPIIRSA